MTLRELFLLSGLAMTAVVVGLSVALGVVSSSNHQLDHIVHCHQLVAKVEWEPFDPTQEYDLLLTDTMIHHNHTNTLEHECHSILKDTFPPHEDVRLSNQ